jgi:hypothetical protein
MSTRSTIAVARADGTVSQVYCHWDGYLSHNGNILVAYYNTQALAEELVNGGDISSLNMNIYPSSNTHSYSSPEDGVTVYYGRDRGESNCEPRVFMSLQDYFDGVDTEEYNYLFLNDEWTVTADYNNEIVGRQFVTDLLKEKEYV